ncbi:MAG: hypothetical protein LWX56_00930 [Ignavibacteria bacterium]|nr:hypothetical protein [Ignavibacteria bacterium]
MKHKYISHILLILIGLVFAVANINCSAALDNSVVINNAAAATIYLNIFGKNIAVKPSETVTIRQVPKGTYSYETMYEKPPIAEKAESQGKTTGTVIMGPGTRIQFFFASRLDVIVQNGVSQTTYIVSVTISSSDKNSVTGT